MSSAQAGSGLSVASLGLKGGSDIVSGFATQQLDQQKAINALFQGEQQQAQFGIQSSQDIIQATGNETAAEFGKLQSDLTDASARQSLTQTLGNISVTRAAGGADLTSPTTAALEGHVTDIANINREAAVSSINAQTAEESAAAAYERQAANYALVQGNAAGAMGQFNYNSYNNAGNVAASMGILSGATDILGGLGKAFAA
jgi:hypothetical protein